MTEIIEANANQVPALADGLKKHKISEDRMATNHTLSNARPGSNKLVYIISDIALRMHRITCRSHSAPKSASKDKTKSK